MAGTGSAGPGWRWDVALSFASAQRDYVQQVGEALKARGVRCFYDADEEIDLWGKYLAEELPAIYGEQAAAVVVFVSAEYADRDWTRLERRAALARAVRERREYVLPARFDETPLPGLLSDMVWVELRTRSPQQFAAMIADKLAALAIAAPEPSATAGDPVQDAGAARPAGAMRVAEVDPRRLGVHAAISVPGVPDEVPPEYVPRDVDAAEFGVRAKVAAAAQRGGFVLLVGGSSVGKTRCAVEAVKALLPDWWLVHPAGPAEVAALARVPTPRIVVWVDELQLYLDGEHGLTGGVVRALLDAPHPAVIIGTLWPDRYTAYTTLPAPGGADPHAREREVLDMAAVIRIDPAFSPAEQGRAHAAAVRDPRLRVALGTAGYGLTQTLAAAPQLVARWQDAKTAHPYAWAVLTAALDAARLGARAPLSTGFLRAAAPGYCTSQQQAEAPGNWFEQALAYATGKLHGAASALSPAGDGMGQIAGYTVADYLIQHASRARRTACPPLTLWESCLTHLVNAGDLLAVGDAARDRCLLDLAERFYRAADSAPEAVEMLSELLSKQGRYAEAEQILRAARSRDNPYAAVRLGYVLMGLDRAGEAEQLLRAALAAGKHGARRALAILLERQERFEEAEAVLRDGIAAQDSDSPQRLGFLLMHELHRPDEAERVLRAAIAARQPEVAVPLASLLRGQGRYEEAEQTLRDGIAAGDPYARFRLAVLLQQLGRSDEAERTCRDGIAVGDEIVRLSLDWLLREQGRLDEAEQAWREGIINGERDAPRYLAELLQAQGRFEEAERVLRDGIAAGHGLASYHLTKFLKAMGRTDEAERIQRHGLNIDGTIAGPGEEAERLRQFGLNPDGSTAGEDVMS